MLKLVDDFVIAQQQSALSVNETLLTGDEEIALSWSIGAVLGNEFVKRLDWVWAMIGDDNDGLYTALFLRAPH